MTHPRHFLLWLSVTSFRSFPGHGFFRRKKSNIDHLGIRRLPIVPDIYYLPPFELTLNRIVTLHCPKRNKSIIRGAIIKASPAYPNAITSANYSVQYVFFKFLLRCRGPAKGPSPQPLRETSTSFPIPMDNGGYWYYHPLTKIYPSNGTRLQGLLYFNYIGP